VEVDGSLAVLRSRMVEKEKINESWDLSTGAIRQEDIGFLGLINRQKEELSALKADQSRLLAELHALCGIQTQQPEEQSVPQKPRSIWNRIRRK
jgi:hypothetical protein